MRAGPRYSVRMNNKPYNIQEHDSSEQRTRELDSIATILYTRPLIILPIIRCSEACEIAVHREALTARVRHGQTPQKDAHDPQHGSYACEALLSEHGERISRAPVKQNTKPASKRQRERKRADAASCAGTST